MIHLPRGIDAEWVKQLVGEQLVTVKSRRGFTRLEWQKLRERNEALDCRVYARAAAWIAGLDRWHERKWRDLEMQLGVEMKLVAHPTQGRRRTGEEQKVVGPEQVRQGITGRSTQSDWLGGRSRGWLRQTRHDA